MKKAFTLAEVMITLAVIGIITAIVMPIMVNSAPKKKYMKFKKAHTTLGKVISELVNSDQYYKDGDLGVNTDGSDVSSKTQFCQDFADVVSAKKVNCSELSKTPNDPEDIVADSWNIDTKAHVDTRCKASAKDVGEEVVTSDGIVYYQVNPNLMFSTNWLYYTWDYSTDKGFDKSAATPEEIYEFNSHYGGLKDHSNGHVFGPKSGFYIYVYKIFCVDIDGIPSNGSENCDDNKDICPFGYGIRVDGKIMNGARADEWLEKDFQGKNESEQ